MKRLLLIMLTLLLLVNIVYANKIGIEIEKGVNAGYEVSMPIDFDVQAQIPFLPKAYIETKPVFTAQEAI